MKKEDKSERNITDVDRKCPDLISDRQHPDLTKLKPLSDGTLIGKKWKVVRSIEPEFGFYTIYVVENEKTNNQAALKIEQKGAITPILRFELFVLLQMEQKNKTKQFCRVFDRGIADTYNWIVVTLCGKNLKTLRKDQPEGKLSLACGFSVGAQCLRALEELHRIGFVHRSVNPSDFAIGRSINGDIKELRTIYLLDFGFARQYLEADGKTHKPPRPKPWVFRGSPRHASRNTFLKQEMSRLDDLEMWFYCIIEMVKGSLPWVAIRNPKSIFEYQKAVRNGLALKEFLGGLPNETTKMMKDIDAMQYKEEPNYASFYQLLDKCIAKTGKAFPYDWETAELAAAKEPDGHKSALSTIPHEKK